MIVVQFDRAWSYNEDLAGNVRRNIPAGWSGERDDDVATAAIALGVARPLRPLTAAQEAMLALARTSIAAGRMPSQDELLAVAGGAPADVPTKSPPAPEAPAGPDVAPESVAAPADGEPVVRRRGKV